MLATGAVAQRPPSAEIRFRSTGELDFPAGYREWVFLSSGLGMTYGPAQAAEGMPPRFDNVFVNPAAYRSFLATGRWPDQTIFVLEIRAAEANVSINNGGRTQGELIAVEAAVKDEARFPERWAYFAFPADHSAARALPRTASCFRCHAANGAVDNTFVQFYPLLREAAREKGTLGSAKKRP